ncbi:zinc finger, CCHC-type containing protein [Tanacetum coccineum]
MDSLDLDVANRGRTRLRLFQFSLHDQASNWLERLPAGSISTWEYLTTHFLAQFFPPGRTAKFLPHHGLDLWLQVQIFYDHIDYTTQMAIDYAAGGRLRKLRPEVAWETIEDLGQYEEGRNDPIFLEKGSLNYKNPNIEQLLGSVDTTSQTSSDGVMIFKVTALEIWKQRQNIADLKWL